jgi:hypothetical protein
MYEKSKFATVQLIHNVKSVMEIVDCDRNWAKHDKGLHLVIFIPLPVIT